MKLHEYPLSDLVVEYGRLFGVYLCVTDPFGIILFSSSCRDIGHIVPFVAEAAKQAPLARTDESGRVQHVLSLCWDKGEEGFLYLLGEPQHTELASRAVYLAIESIVRAQGGAEPPSKEIRQALMQPYIIKGLIGNTVDEEEIVELMKRMEVDATLLRAAICIEFDFKTNRYFNINLNLGYDLILEEIKQKALETIHRNKYLNTHDLCGFSGENEIVVLKSFIPNSDFSKIYMVLDRICTQIEEDLSEEQLLNIRIAYGNLYGDLFEMRQSYKEAKEIIAVGRIEYPEMQFYNINTVIIDIISRSLHPQIISKIIWPTIQKLQEKDTDAHADLLLCAEAFVDSCMSFTKAAQKSYLHRNTINSRLVKFREITGLDPVNHFIDALIVKLIAIHLRHGKSRAQA